ncbi:hypothetical protein [Nocardia macrotermitis]|uniref:Uncharacterized protein n=1 Tax=Nocardia macrotermitis TaxID=2585198 RepID=A0A7K0D3E9_9NOCA|nr:hypothetical protein [Nocardia macrotermitis]MQY20263.1 hypothetical protein [Nocardia macrotermitis]
MANPYQPGSIPQPSPPPQSWPQPGLFPGQPVSVLPAPNLAQQRNKAELVAAVSLILAALVYVVFLVVALVEGYHYFLTELAWILAAISATVAGLMLVLGRRSTTARLLAAISSGVFFTHAMDELLGLAPAALVGGLVHSAIGRSGILPAVSITVLALVSLISVLVAVASDSKTVAAASSPQQPGAPLAPAPVWSPASAPNLREPASGTPAQFGPNAFQPQQQFPIQPGQFPQPPATPATYQTPQQTPPQTPGWQQPIPQQPSQYPNPPQPQAQSPIPGQPDAGYNPPPQRPDQYPNPQQPQAQSQVPSQPDAGYSTPPQQPSPYPTPPQGPQQ